VNKFTDFKIGDVKDEFGIITYEILYCKNMEKKKRERSFFEIFIFVKNIKKKYQTPTMD
jgi:hypothetical protein